MRDLTNFRIQGFRDITRDAQGRISVVLNNGTEAYIGRVVDVSNLARDTRPGPHISVACDGKGPSRMTRPGVMGSDGYVYPDA